MGFWSGFAQGWEAESERIERRKLFQQEQTERRAATLGELLPKFVRGGALGAAGQGSDDATPASKDHLLKVFIGYGGTAEQAAQIDAEGGVYGLQAAVQVLEENKDALTPELFTRLPEAIKVTPRDSSGAVNPQDIADTLWGAGTYAGFSPDQRMIIDMQAEALNQPKAPYVSVAMPTPKPLRPEDVNSTVKAMSDGLMERLVYNRQQLNRQINEATASGTGDVTGLTNQAQAYDQAIEDLKAGAITPGINLVGSEFVGAFIKNDPRIAANPDMFGAWAGAIKGAGQTEEAIPIEPPSVGKTYSSTEEVQADIDAGLVKEGDLVNVNGQSIRVKF